MAFKRHAALLTGTALAGSLLFAQPTLAEETADTVKCYAITETEVTTVQAAPIKRNSTFKVVSYDVEDDADSTVKDLEANPLEFEVGDDVEAGEYLLSLGSGGAENEHLNAIVTSTTETVETEQEIDCAQVEIADITLTAGEKKDIEVTLPGGTSDLEVTAPEGLVVTLDDTTITVDATDAEVDEYEVTFTYQAAGAKEKLTGSFTVTVEKKDEGKKDEPKGSANFLGSFKGFGSSK